jgi:predicted Zn finger-like uncharacterized protein
VIVACEQCRTRFKLDESRLPPGGAKVRCSRCSYKFHVKPEPPVVKGQSTPKDTPPVSREEEPDLENPQFLHDKPLPGPDSPFPRIVPDDPVLGLDGDPDRETDTHFLGETDPALATPESFPDDLEPEESQTKEGASIDIGDQLDALRREGPIEETGPGYRVSEPEDPPKTPEPSLPQEITEDFSLSESPEAPHESEEEDDSSWSDWGDSTEEEEEGWGDPTLEEGFAPEESWAPSESKKRFGPDWFPNISIAARFTSALQVVTLVVSLLLVGGTARTLLVSLTHQIEGPKAVRGVGWTASDIQTFHVHDLAGNPALVVRGHLDEWSTSRGRHGRPAVIGTLLDHKGRKLGSELFAREGRLGDRAVSPQRLGVLAEDDALALTGKPGESDVQLGGFTLLFLNPPPQARQVRLELR